LETKRKRSEISFYEIYLFYFIYFIFRSHFRMERPVVHLLDYGAGNVRSVINAVNELGAEIIIIDNPQMINQAKKILFPGVGSFGTCVEALESKGFVEPLKEFIKSGKPLLGVCLGMQLLFEESEESPGYKGLGIIPSKIRKFDRTKVTVPHMGWNGVKIHKDSNVMTSEFQEKDFYFVHSYRAIPDPSYQDWILTTTDYGDDEFVSSVQKGNTLAFQFHPEKSSDSGLKLLKNFLFSETVSRGHETGVNPNQGLADSKKGRKTQLTKRIIACLDVRENEHGDLVVTKGDQYDVKHEGSVRNLGKPVELAHRYFLEGADEVTFLNITSFRNCPLTDMPMLQVLKKASEKVFVPLTIGGGIRDMEFEGKKYSAVDVADQYFRSGADKVSIGSDAVYATEEYLANGKKKTGKSCIEQIANKYGSQAVVISVDPKKVIVKGSKIKEENGHYFCNNHYCIKTIEEGKEIYCWYQCTIKGGRELRDLDVIQLVTSCEDLGAGEILLNSIDKDGSNSGFDIDLVNFVKSSVRIPVIASSGAGKASHFVEVFLKTNVESALAAGIFHRKEVPISEVKNLLISENIPCRK